MSTLFKEIHLIDPKSGRDEITDLLIDGGKIADIRRDIPAGNAEVVSGKGKYLLPGFIDLHTHFREPGFESKETIFTGCMAALKGGFVASVSMPNTQPPCDNPGTIDLILWKAKEIPYHIFPAGTISKGREGKELSEMADLKKSGIVAVTDDGDWVADSLLMRRALDYASMLNLIVMSHADDRRLANNGVMNEGLMSTKLGLHGIPAAGEVIAVARDIELARITGAHLHISHVSAARSVELIRRAKEEKIRITAEVTPHHLSLSEESLEGYNTNFKMNPPLRTREDVEAVRRALRIGILDCVATDHAPHTPEDKMAEYDHAPFGVIGLETAFGVVMTDLFHGEKWSIEEIVKVFSVRPSEILNLGPAFGQVVKGTQANLTLVDPNQEWVVTHEELRSKSKNSCFLKRTLKGKVLGTVCAGKFWKFN